MWHFTNIKIVFSISSNKIIMNNRVLHNWAKVSWNKYRCWYQPAIWLKQPCNTTNDLIQIKYWCWQISLTFNLNMEIIYCHKTTHSILQLQIRYCVEKLHITSNNHQRTIFKEIIHHLIIQFQSRFALAKSIFSRMAECYFGREQSIMATIVFTGNATFNIRTNCFVKPILKTTFQKRQL